MYRIVNDPYLEPINTAKRSKSNLGNMMMIMIMIRFLSSHSAAPFAWRI